MVVTVTVFRARVKHIREREKERETGREGKGKGEGEGERATSVTRTIIGDNRSVRGRPCKLRTIDSCLVFSHPSGKFDMCDQGQVR